MEEDLLVTRDSVKNCSISVIEDEKEKVKDFVYKHFREARDGPVLNAKESSIKEYLNYIKKDKPTLNKPHCKNQQGAVFSGKILSFGCSVCKDDCTYSPNDLLKHFRTAHTGTLPTYPCDLCGFVTNEFPALQRHRIEHRNTLVTCELCDDDVQYSLLLLTRHYIMCHSRNGQFNCDWCEFTTVDAGTFVQHIHHHNESPWKCSKCKHISMSEEDHQRHMKAHAGTFPFTCQICGYGAARNEYLKKHTEAVHKQEFEKRNTRKGIEESSTPANSSATLKHLLKKSGESQEAQRTSKLNCLSGSVANQNGKLIKSELSLEETQHLVDGTVAKKDNGNWSKGSHNTEQSTPEMLQECDNSAISDATSHTNPNGLTVLMVKNKISLPPNCTTKVMGFKMVDGKKHLVLKVIPSAKQDSPIQNHSSAEDVGFFTTNPMLDKSKDSVENGECVDSKSATYAISPRSGSCIQMDQDDIMAVKVKIEEEETSICNLDSTLDQDEEHQSSLLLNMSSTCADVLYPMSNEFDHVGDQSHPVQTACSERSTFDNLVSATCNSDAAGHSGSKISNITGLSSPLKVAQETLLSKSAHTKIAENCEAGNELSSTETVADKLTDQYKGNSPSNTINNDDQTSQSTPETTNGVRSEIKRKNCQQHFKKLSTNPVPPSEPSPPSSGFHRENAPGSKNCTQNSPNQEVFTFHNYSKETFSTSATQRFGHMSQQTADKDSIGESSKFCLSLAESPEPFMECDNGEMSQEMTGEGIKKVLDGDIEVDGCIASVDDSSTEDENPESVLQDFNIIKIEEESIPISKKTPENNSSSTSLGSFVEEHSDEIITQQLNKERVRPSNSSNDSLKQTKTTLRILQLPEGKQPLLLRTTENRFAMPLQVKSSPGFKLITNSANPQINVSYMKPGVERSRNQTGVTLTPNTSRMGVSAPKAGIAEKGTTLLSAVQPSVGTTSSHYLINSPGFKGPVLLSSTPHNTPTEKSSKTQPTCYLVQRSVPLVHTPSTPGLRLASTQLPLNSRPVLAMPVSSADKSNTLQPGRQAFLLRYISPPKSGLLLNNQETKTGTQCSQTSEGTGNKVIFKIVTPTGSLLTSGTPTSSSQPLFLATRPQTQCFLVSPNTANGNASSGAKKMVATQNSAQKHLKESCMSPSQMNVKVQPCEAEKPILAPRPIRPPSQRKRRRKALFDELPTTVHKARRLTNRVLSERETAVLWKPVAKEVERTLRLAPFSSAQQIKCPRRYQPVVVLNHPDADIPEVANIMKVVNRYKGAVTKVSLSQKTIQALSELGAQGKKYSTKGMSSHGNDPRPRAVQSSVRERFLLKLKLKKKSKKKYEVVDPLSGCKQESAVFDCWFCGRLFNSQEDWIGHGQRHLMEATRDWNKLF